MTTWYEVKLYGMDVRPVEVGRSTDLSVWVKDFSGKFRRRAIASGYESYFPSFDEAKTFLVERETRRLENAKQTVTNGERSLAAVLALEEPK